MEDECELGVQTIKIYGESVGVTSVPEEAAKYLAAEVTFHLKEIIQDASKVYLLLWRCFISFCSLCDMVIVSS